jgi:hypothetical protein
MSAPRGGGADRLPKPDVKPPPLDRPNSPSKMSPKSDASVSKSKPDAPPPDR